MQNDYIIALLPRLTGGAGQDRWTSQIGCLASGSPARSLPEKPNSGENANTPIILPRYNICAEIYPSKVQKNILWQN